MFRILANTELCPGTHRVRIAAPRVAKARHPGQFVMVRLDVGHERIPLTIADANPAEGWIELVIQAIGVSTKALVAVPAGGAYRDVAGPLGRHTDLLERGRALCVGGGVGTAVVLPIAQELSRTGVEVISVIGGRSAERVILAEDLAKLGEVRICTDDGSLGRKGVVTTLVEELFAQGTVDMVYAVGPVPMMDAVTKVCMAHQVPVTVSLNPVMIDGTGMCGGCRVSVGGEIRFAGVDGPEFDGAKVDFAELRSRLGTYRTQEQACAESACKAQAAATLTGNTP